MSKVCYYLLSEHVPLQDENAAEIAGYKFLFPLGGGKETEVFMLHPNNFPSFTAAMNLADIDVQEFDIEAATIRVETATIGIGLIEMAQRIGVL